MVKNQKLNQKLYEEWQKENKDYNKEAKKKRNNRIEEIDALKVKICNKEKLFAERFFKKIEIIPHKTPAAIVEKVKTFMLNIITI